MTDELPLVCRVVEGAQPLDTEAQTIGWMVLDRSYRFRPPGEICEPLQAGEWSRISAKVVALIPRPAPPPLEVGAGVERTVDACPQVGWVLSLHGSSLTVEGAYSGQQSVWRREQVTRAVPPAQMPPYQPPGGIVSKGPPEVVDEFWVNGTRWVYRSECWFLYPPVQSHPVDLGAVSYAHLTDEQCPWVARALGRGRR